MIDVVDSVAMWNKNPRSLVTEVERWHDIWTAGFCRNGWSDDTRQSLLASQQQIEEWADEFGAFVVAFRAFVKAAKLDVDVTAYQTLAKALKLAAVNPRQSVYLDDLADLELIQVALVIKYGRETAPADGKVPRKNGSVAIAQEVYQTAVECGDRKLLRYLLYESQVDVADRCKVNPKTIAKTRFWIDRKALRAKWLREGKLK